MRLLRFTAFGPAAPGGVRQLPGDASLPAPVSLRLAFARVGHSAFPQNDTRIFKAPTPG